jgi:carbonic anhydrase
VFLGAESDGVVKESLEIAVEHKAPIVVVLGHTDCSAVRKAVDFVVTNKGDQEMSPIVASLLPSVVEVISRIK